MKYTREQSIAAFWSKVDVRGPTDCWEWKGCKQTKNFENQVPYGILQFQTERVYAHRLAFFLSGGYLPEGQGVLHTCDNPPCCNPAHLFAGTNTDNNEDKVRKGRQAKGVHHGMARLTREQVFSLRADRLVGMTYQQLADKYSITHAAARRIALAITYKDVQ